MWEPVNYRSILGNYEVDENIRNAVGAEQKIELRNYALKRGSLTTAVIVLDLLLLQIVGNGKNLETVSGTLILTLIGLIMYLLVALPVMTYLRSGKLRLYCSKCRRKLLVIPNESGSGQAFEVFYVCHPCKKYNIEAVPPSNAT